MMLQESHKNPLYLPEKNTANLKTSNFSKVRSSKLIKLPSSEGHVGDTCFTVTTTIAEVENENN